MGDEKMLIITECRKNGFFVKSYTEEEIIWLLKQQVKIKKKNNNSYNPKKGYNLMPIENLGRQNKEDTF